VPVLADVVRDGLVSRAVLRSALIGLAGSRLGTARPLLTLEQARLASGLRATAADHPPQDNGAFAAELAALLPIGFGLRKAARSGRSVLPAPLVQAAVAGLGTWALAKVVRQLETRRAAA